MTLTAPYILLTIDVEDWFQVENFKQWIPFSSWSSYPFRVEKNTHRLLDLFDSKILNTQSVTSEENNGVAINLLKYKNCQSKITVSQFHQETEKGTNNPSYPVDPVKEKKTPKATFFILGWLAERLPHLVREIHRRGHEIGSHGMNHELSNKIKPEDFKKELIESKKLLEDLTGSAVYGYRAPSFSVNNDILKAIQDSGYLYDSSYNSFSMHGRYGQIDLSQNEKKGIAIQIPKTQHSASNNRHLASSKFYELPVSNLEFRNAFSFQLSAFSSKRNFQKNTFSESFTLPWGGGAYFRLIPFPLFKMGIQNILKKENAYLMYMHPWEIDPEQPRVNEASAFYNFRHYTNLSKTYSKLSKLIDHFQHCRFVTCNQYLNEIVN